MPRSRFSRSNPALTPPAGLAPAYVFAAPGSLPPRQRLTQALAAGSLLALAAQPFWRPLPRAAASTFTVTNTNPAGAGSLLQAIRSANTHPGGDIITFAPGLTGTIALTATLHITDSVQIVGPGPGKLSVSAGHAFAVLYLNPASVGPITTTISGLTLRDGLGNPDISGGIYDVDTDLTLDNVDLLDNTGGGRGGSLDFGSSENVGLTIRNSLISGNSGFVGGGIYVRGAPLGLVIQNTRFVSNTATTKNGGGGAYLYGPVSMLIEDSSFLSNTASLGQGGGLKLGTSQGGTTIVRRSTILGNSAKSGAGIAFYKPQYDTLIEDSTISGNTASLRGGGLEFHTTAGGTHTVRRTTIGGNTALYGGGVYLYGISNPLSIQDTTISGNHATAIGGGIYWENPQPATLMNSTVVSNTAAISGGGIHVSTGTFPITDTIIAHNLAPLGPDISGTFQLRYDLVQVTGTAIITDAGGNLFGLDPLLGALANNGGLTQTHLPRRNSPAINAGDPAFAGPPATDQRGNPRVLGGRLDIGAVEVEELFLPLLRR